MSDNSILSELLYHHQEGALRYKDVRYLLIRPETLASIQSALEAKIGYDHAGEILYAGGFTGGQLSGRKYKETFGLSNHESVEFMCRMGGEIGWGFFRLVEIATKPYRLVVEVDYSPFAIAYQDVSETGDEHRKNGVCHLIRGVLGGLGNGIFNTPVNAMETQCLALGDKVCRFEITGEE